MKNTILSILLGLFLCTPCFGRDLSDPSILKGYWRLNSNAQDYSGNGNDGTWAGDEAYGTAYWGASTGELGGDDDYVDTNATTISNTAFTISVWINSDTQGSTQTIVSQWKSGTSNRLQLIKITANSVGFAIAGSTKALSSAINANQWYHVVGTYDGATVTTYIDGVYAASEAYSSGVEQDADTLIGTYSSGEYFNGQIAEVRIYNVVLGLDEINQLYQLNYPQQTSIQQPIDQIPDVSDSSLKGAWLNKAVVGAADLSSNNNDGTATDVVWESVGGDFNGTSSVIVIPDMSGDLSDEATLLMWVKLDAATPVGTKGGLVELTGSATTTHYPFTDGKLYCNIFRDDRLDPITLSTSIDRTSWHIFAVVNQPGTDGYKIYQNDEEIYSGTGEATIDIGSGGEKIGVDRTGGVFFDGQIKDVRIYSSAKSASWISNEFQKGVPDSSLVLHTLSGEKDLSRYEHTLTNSGAILGDGMEFGGANAERVDCGDSIIDDGNDTIIFWAKIDSAGENNAGKLLSESKAQISTLSNSALRFTSDSVTFNSFGNNSYVDYFSHYVIVRESDGTATLYRNGILISSVDSGTPTNGTTNMFLGNNNDSTRTFDGTIKDLKIHNRAFTASEVLDEYNRTKKF